MSLKKLNWALMSTARINDTIIPAIKKSKYANLYAVASRSGKNLREYAKKREIPIFYHSYADLLKDKNIDVIYISLPNHLHSKWIILAAKAKEFGGIRIDSSPLTVIKLSSVKFNGSIIADFALLKILNSSPQRIS